MKILISGAGIAGATAACLLGRRGHTVTVIERDQGIRSSGNPVDVRGRAYGVVQTLDLVPRLQDVATSVRSMAIVDSDGRRVVGMKTEQQPGRELEVPRADLSAILIDEARDDVELRFDDTTTGLAGDDAGVDVTFDRAPDERFDLVVGADGLHSNVRRLAFGPERDFIRKLGMYVATVRIPGPPDHKDTVVMHNEPGTAIALHPSTGKPVAAFMFRSAAGIDPRDRQAGIRLLERSYSGGGWRTQEFLTAYREADDAYFDAISRVRIPNWSRGHMTLLGDAASCVSLFGEGSSSAMAGARVLADSLTESPRDVPAALRRYERIHRQRVARGQRAAPLASRVLIPASQFGITLRNTALGLGRRR